ncbi:alpha/beta hydrolase [bacterium]|nr:alpha/beta hydrolase [bacterium]
MRRFGYRGTGTLRLDLPNPTDVQVLVEAPGVASHERLYMASNVNGWNPRNDRYALRRMPDGRFEIRQLLAPGSHFEFKITRGGWDRVEVAADGSDLPNHTHKVTGQIMRLEVKVADWQDHHPRAPKPRTTVGDVRSLGEFTIHTLNRRREVLVYLPPRYEFETDRRYPVMYMWDGQNLFDESTAFSGEWHVDEILEAMIPKGHLPPMIVVAIYNGQEHRLSEQSPWSAPHFDVVGEGDAFLDWVAYDLKHRIDRGFRTLTDPANTGVGGSSMGGLTSLYAGFKYSHVFGKVLAMSSALWFADKQIFPYVRSQPKPHGSRFYVDCGRFEGLRRSQLSFLRQNQEMAQLLRDKGFSDGHDLMFVEDPNGTHSEHDWARRLPQAMRFLWQ